MKDCVRPRNEEFAQSGVSKHAHHVLDERRLTGTTAVYCLSKPRRVRLKLYLYCSNSKSYFGTVPRARRRGTNSEGSAMHCGNCIYLNVHGHGIPCDATS